MPIDWNSFRTGGAFGGALAQSLLPARALPGLEADQRIGPYVVERELARGGMAIVYVARRADGEFEQRVALKWMAPSQDEPALEAMFRRERDILASLEHPGIARLLDGGRTPEGMLWFAMELVEGEPIDRWCTTHATKRDARIRLIVGLCEALAFAHGRLLIHRDIKPANVLVDGRGRVRLLDFGIARLADQADLQGHHALTPGFASPEQLRGEPTTVASDVYQVGLLLALLLGCVRAPALGRHATAVEGASEGAHPTALPEAALRSLPAELAAILRRATAAEPTARYATVAALQDDLQRLLDRRPVIAHQGSSVYALRCLARRQPLAMAASTLALGALVIGLVVANLARLEARRAEARAVQAQRTSQETTDFLISIFRAPDPRNNPGLDLTARELLERGISRIDGLAAEPTVQANLLGAFSEVTWALGDYDRARPLAERALTMRESEYPRDAGAIASLLDRLGGIARDQARFDDAITSYERALAELQTAGEAVSNRAAALNNNLGIALRRVNRLDEAAAAMERALAISVALGVPPEYSLLSNLGTVELSRGRHAAARERFLETGRTLPANMPAGHPARAILEANLALATRQLGLLGEALAHAQRADAIELESLGPKHPNRAETLQGLAAILGRLGRTEEAEAALDLGLANLREALGPQNPRAWALLSTRAHAAAVRGESRLADQRYLDAATAIATLPPAQSARMRAVAARMRAAGARSRGEFTTALELADEALEIARGAKLDGDAAMAALNGALAALALGQREDAQRRFDEAVAIAQCGVDPCRIDQADSRVLRAQWYAATGDLDNAFATLDAAIDHPQWTTWMLELDGLDGLHDDPRWRLAKQRLRDRIARDGDPPITAPPEPR